LYKNAKSTFSNLDLLGYFSGLVTLDLIAGKNQSHLTNLQPIANGVVNFNTNIKLNVDDSALDTKRVFFILSSVP
jgi:hypothetical protein